ncbi:hypothetical protein GF402_05370 [Candidatus Fermentibacteria bacterium]|nr:hypothetical protein [Candidatus Fermentibacteria bacterium]
MSLVCCILWALCAAPAADSLPARLGIPLSLRFDVPEGWSVGELPEDSTYTVLSQDGPLVTVVPLLPGTLSVHPLRAWSGSDTTSFSVPPVPVEPRFADTLYNVAPGVFPVGVDLPEGRPEDYLRRLQFWEVWGGDPGGVTKWIIVGACLVLLAVAATLHLARRRRRAVEPSGTPEPPGGLREDILALLEHPSYGAADWAEFYRRYEELMRMLVARKSGIADRSLTYRQLRDRLRDGVKGADLYDRLSPLVRETEMQRYAGWGSTRDRAARFVRSLAELAGEGGER